MWMRRFTLLLASAGLPLMMAVSVLAAERVALVVGNAAYEQEIAALKNPVNDAVAMAAALRRLGFEVIEGRDLDEDAFYDKITAFDIAARSAKVALLFYAGHGMQVDGRNYLAPVDLRLETKQDLKRGAIELATVLEVMRSETNLVILDACRNNPLARELARSLGLSRAAAASRGLTRVESASGTLIAYATEPGAVAADGTGDHSPYTAALLEHIETPGLSVNDLFTKVTASVLSSTDGKQKPWTHASLSRVVRLVAAVDPGPGACDRELDLEYWRSVRDSTDPGDYEVYLSNCPQGQFARLARKRLWDLQRPDTPAAHQKAEQEARQRAQREAEAQRLAEERRRQQEGERLDLVMVEGGSFTMGCQSGRDSDCSGDEKPAHQVQVRSFEIGKYEVTQALWEAVMGDNPSHFKDCPECPVEGVSWDDIQGFLVQLSARTGKRYRLPTEAEWEYAARGGRQSQGSRYAGGNDVGSVGWYGDNSGDRTHPVGEKRANELGLHDMSGNVWEWVQDCWNKKYDGAPRDGGAWERGDCSQRVVRGGSWYYYFPRFLRAANRNRYSTGIRNYFLGFRIARTLAP